MPFELSREAIITLRPPGFTVRPAPGNYCAPSLGWLSGRWHISHSTDVARASHRDARVSLVVASGGERITVKPSHQTADSLDVNFTLPVTFRPSDLRDGAASVFEPAIRTSADQGAGAAAQAWEVLAWGKEGQLEDWMREDGTGWIADTSGEVRGDWRNSYIVVLKTSSAAGAGEKGTNGMTVEVWDRFGAWKPLTDETIKKIRTALALGDGIGAGSLGELAPVGMDNGRDTDDHRGEQ